MIVAPITMTPNVAKAYSCSGSSSTAHTPSASSVSGSKGSCSTAHQKQRLRLHQPFPLRILQMLQTRITQVRPAQQDQVALSQVALAAQQTSRLPSHLANHNQVLAPKGSYTTNDNFDDKITSICVSRKAFKHDKLGG